MQVSKESQALGLRNFLDTFGNYYLKGAAPENMARAEQHKAAVKATKNAGKKAGDVGHTAKAKELEGKAQGQLRAQKREEESARQRALAQLARAAAPIEKKYQKERSEIFSRLLTRNS